MKKLLLFLLLPLWMLGQTPTGQEQTFPYGIQNEAAPTVAVPNYLTTSSALGVYGKIEPINLPVSTATQDSLDLKLNISDLPTNLTLYPTTTASDVGGYVVMVKDIHDVRFDDTAVDVSTPAITTTGQLIFNRISDAGILIGQPGVFNITTFGNIRRLSGSGTATFYFEVYHRDLAGTETLICTSSTSATVSSGTYMEFTTSGIWNDGDFIATDRIVIKTYANRIAGGSDPVYQFQFGGTQPVRTLLPVPFSVVDAGYELKTNKQNSLAVDGTAEKYPTVDAINAGVVKLTVSAKQTIASTITATANDSETVGIEMSSAFVNGAFTGVTNTATKVAGGRFSIGNYSLSAKTNLGEKLLVKNEGTLGNTAGSYKYIADFQQANATNINRFQITSYRRGAGSTFQGAGFRLQSAVDNSATDGSAAYIEIGATDPTSFGSAFISFGTGGTDRLSILANGKILINKLTSTGEQLQVNGTGNFSDDLYAPNINSVDAGNIDWQALGDSITYGEGSTTGTTSYANIIQTKANFKSLSKQAVSGITVKPTSGRGELYTQVSAVTVGTELITLMVGVNDAIVNNTLGDLPTVLGKTYASLDKTLSFTEAFRYNIEYLKVTFPNAKIIVISPLKTTSAWTTSANLQKYIDAEIAICNYLSVPFIDANNLSGIYPTGTFTPDGLHPNDAGYALLADCVLKGIINPSTVKKVDISTIVTDAIVNNEYYVAPSQNAVFDALALKAPLASPTFTGTPEAPTATVGTNTTQLATTAFVQGEISTAVKWTTSSNDIYNSNSGNIGIGTSAVPTKAKLEVKGVGGTGAIASFNDASGVERFRFNPDGSLVTVNVAASQISEGSGGAVLKFNNTPSYFNFTTELPINLSVQRNVIGVIQTFANSSGSQDLNLINLSPTINQTGSSTSITRGLYINPTLTSAVDFRAIDVTAGKVVVNSILEYADNAAAVTAGLPVGAFYRTGDVLKIVH